MGQLETTGQAARIRAFEPGAAAARERIPEPAPTPSRVATVDQGASRRREDSLQEEHLRAARSLLVGRKPPVRPDRSSRLRTHLGGMVDVTVFEMLHHLFTAAHRSNMGDSVHPDDTTEDHYRALEAGWLELSAEATRDPGRYFPLPAPPAVRITRRRKIRGGTVEDLTFPGHHAPHRETARQLHERYPENATAHARHYRHADPGHPALVWLHGWGMGQYRLEASVCRARALFRQGLDVYLYMEPFHHLRRPKNVLFAGMLHPSTDLDRSNEAFLQTAWEIRAILARHRHLTGARGGVMGLSLGGYLAAMMASIAPELAFAIPILPMADVPSLMWSNGEGTPDRLRAEAAGVTFDDFCLSMAIHAPLARELAIPKERVLLIGARGDRIIPPDHTVALWRHWGKPRLHWASGGHVLQFGRLDYVRQIEDFLRGLDLR